MVFDYLDVNDGQVPVRGLDDGVEVGGGGGVGGAGREEGPEGAAQAGGARLPVALVVHAQRPVQAARPRGVQRDQTKLQLKRGNYCGVVYKDTTTNQVYFNI